jgi:hypothetical protein
MIWQLHQSITALLLLVQMVMSDYGIMEIEDNYITEILKQLVKPLQ